MKSLLFMLVITALLFPACDISDDIINQNQGPTFSLNSEYQLDIPEPSDLCYNPQDNSLWTVSDQTNKIYHIDITGNIIQILPFIGNDLEGIICDQTQNSLWITEETNRNLVKVSFNGDELERYDQIIPGADNNGLEGICLYNDLLILLKEKNPGQFIKLNSQYEINEIITLDFADDYSGITYDPVRDGFWIISDQNQSIYLWDSINGVRQEFPLPYTKTEGVCLLPDGNTFMFVSDDQNLLYSMILDE